jgi:hypothetical protein
VSVTSYTFPRRSTLVDPQGRPYEYRSTVEMRASRYELPRTGDFRGTPGPQINSWGGIVDYSEEHQSWATLRARVDRVNEMTRRSATVRAALKLRTDPIVTAAWAIAAPTHATAQEREAADWLTGVLIDDPWTPFDAVLRWCLTAMEYGFSVVEGRYESRDLMRYPRQWEPRSAFSISRASQPWVFAGRDLVAINQDPSAVVNDVRPEQIPARNCILSVYSDDGTPEGQSALRSVGAAEFLLDRALHYWAVAVLRWSSPTPYAMLDKDTETFSSSIEAVIANAQTQLERVRTHQTGAMAFYPGISVGTLGISEGERVKAEEMVKFCLEEIARGLQVPFLILGQAGNTGAYALGDVFFDGYLSIVEADARWLAATLQRRVLDPLVIANWGPDVRVPRLVAKGVKRMAKGAVVDAYTKARASGMPAAVGDWRWMRELLELPPPDVDAVSDDEQTDAPPPTAPAADTGDEDLDGEEDEEDTEGEAGLSAAPAAVDPTDQRVREAIDQVDGGWSWPRALRPHERVVNFRAIDGAMSDGVDAIVRATAYVQSEMSRSLMGQVREAVSQAAGAAGAPGVVRAIREIRVPADLRVALVDAILVELVEVSDAGRKSQREEIRRGQATRRSGLAMTAHLVAEDEPPSDPRNATALLRSRADRMADGIVTELEAVARDGAQRLLETGASLGEVDAGVFAMVDARMKDRSLKRVAAAAAGAVPKAMNFGRREELRKQAAASGERWRIYNSTLLDANTCQPCIRAEQYTQDNEVLVDSPEHIALQPPLEPNAVTGDGCDGGLAVGSNYCRCIQVAETTT